jgi:hypothetical protein
MSSTSFVNFKFLKVNGQNRNEMFATNSQGDSPKAILTRFALPN